MPRNKNFLEQPVSAALTADTDFELLFARHTDAARVAAHTIAVDRIRPNPFQPRQTFEDIDELAQAIRVQGFTSRLRVRQDPTQPGYFQLVYGERRLRAAQVAGLTEVPCDVAEHSDDDLIEIGLAENIQRRDLHPLEEGQAFQTLITHHGYTQLRLAERIGKDRSYIETRLALLRAPEDVQQMLVQRPDALRAAREIAKLPTAEARRPLITGVLNAAFTRDDVTALVRQALAEPAEATPSPMLTTASQEPVVEAGSVPARPPRAQSGTVFDRVRSHDIPALRATFARWRLAAPNLTPAERTELLAFIDEHIAVLEQLTVTLGGGSRTE
ncbi:MAG: ParB/RepB/Spo0J family partition protein [Chloroflexota bacterium]|nr:ParB/RepB/Spo0J family partition protein [Chloroflexota bacterium]